jgi:streptomycin 6-kinase
MAFPPLDPAMRDRLTTRFGPSVASWLDALPAQVATLAARWEVTVGSPPLVDGGSTSVVVHGRAAAGAAVVLKLTPEPDLARAEGDVLEAASAGSVAGSAGASSSDSARHAPPFPRLLARDDALGALLIEAIEPGTPLDRSAGPLAAPAVGALLRGLRSIPAADGLPPLRERVAWCFDLFERRVARDGTEAHGGADARGGAEAHGGDGRAADLAALGRGRALALRLADGWDAAPVFVHGDLHPGNVLDGGPVRGLVAIDPRPCMGDPGFDAADLALWGVARVDESERQIDAVATVAGCDAERLAAWCAALAAMAAVSLAARPDAVPRRAERLATLRALAA